MSIDHMAPQERTWSKGFDLSPMTPQIRQSIANVFRRAAADAPTEDERIRSAALADKWEREAAS